jgi:hypothetical protein
LPGVSGLLSLSEKGLVSTGGKKDNRILKELPQPGFRGFALERRCRNADSDTSHLRNGAQYDIRFDPPKVASLQKRSVGANPTPKESHLCRYRLSKTIRDPEGVE